MKISKCFIFICTLVLLGAGMALLAAWDMQRAVAAPGPDTWFQTTSAPSPVAFYGFAQCPDEPDVFYVLGSYPGANTFYRYHASTDTWYILTAYPSVIERSAIVCYGGRIYAAGGDNGPGATALFYIYDIAAGTWSQAADLPHPLKQAAIGAWDGHLYLVGGTTTSTPWPPIDHVDVYDIASNTWSDQAGEHMPVATDSAGYYQQGFYLYIVGGWSGDFSQNVNATQRYDMSSGSWEAGPEFTSARAAFALAGNGAHLYAIGGDADGGSQFNPTDLVESLDLSSWPGGAWVDVADPIPLSLEGNSAGFCSESVSGGEIWSVGGVDSGQNLLDDVFYRPTGEPCFDFYFGDLPRESMELGNHPGDAAHYVLPLINNGTLTDTFDITASGVWTITVPITIGPIAPGLAGLVMVDVEVPEGANPGDFDTAVVTVTSQGDPGASDSAVLTTSVTDWQEATNVPYPVGFQSTAQCPEEPNVFYILGGGTPELYTIDDVSRFDASSNVWTWLTNLPMGGGWGQAVTCYDNKLYVVGSGSSRRLDVYDITTDTWTFLGFPPRFVWAAGMGAWDGKLYLVGGDTGNFIPTNNVDIYDIASNTWSVGPPMPVASEAYGVAQTGPYLYVVGGFSGDWNNNLDITLRLNMATESWDRPGPAFTSRRAITALSVTQSHLYAIAGDENGFERLDATGLVEVLDLSLWPGGAWTNLGQPLPWSIEGNASACTEAMAGGEIWSVGGASGIWLPSGPFNLITIDNSYYLPVGEGCVSYGVKLSNPIEGEGEIGHPVTYTLTITNTGVVTDYYNIEVTTTWGAGSPLGGPGGPVGPGESIQNLIVLNVPLDVHVGDQGLTEIIATSYSNPTAVDNTLITTTVIPTYDVHISPESLALSGFHGEVITYTLTVSNMGTITDTVNLTYTGSTWEVVLPVTSLDLGVGESAEVVIYVIIPDSAWPGDSHQLILTATSAGNPSANDNATLTTTALWYRTLIPLAHKN